MDLYQAYPHAGGIVRNVQQHNQQQGQMMLREVQLRQNRGTPPNVVPQPIATSPSFRQHSIPVRTSSGAVRMVGARQYGPQHFSQMHQRGPVYSQVQGRASSSYLQQLPIQQGQYSLIPEVQMQPQQANVQQHHSALRGPSSFPVSNPNQGGLIFQQQLQAQGGYRMLQQPKQHYNTAAVQLPEVQVWRRCTPNQQPTNSGANWCSLPRVPSVSSHPTVTYVQCPSHVHSHQGQTLCRAPAYISGGPRHPQYPPIVMPAPFQPTLASPCQFPQSNHVIQVVNTRMFENGAAPQVRQGAQQGLVPRPQAVVVPTVAAHPSLGPAVPLPTPYRVQGMPGNQMGAVNGNRRMQRVVNAEQEGRGQSMIVTGYNWGSHQDISIRREGSAVPISALGENNKRDELVISAIGHDDDDNSNDSERLYVDTSQTDTASEEEVELKGKYRPSAPVVTSDEDGDENGDVDEN